MDAENLDQVDDGAPTLRFRAIFISDIHLGTASSQTGRLLDFLRHTDSAQLYLVGDVIDGWQLRRRWYWHQSHNDVIQKVLRKARKGTRVTYIAGNHDEAMRQFLGLAFGGIDIRDEAEHVTADGRRLLVIHGDLFDAVVQQAKWLAHVGDAAYIARAQAEPLVQPPAREAGLPVLVARAVPQAPGEERGQLHRQLRDGARRTRRAGAASMAWSAATSTRPRSATSGGSCTATTGIGSRASPRWWRPKAGS